MYYGQNKEDKIINDYILEKYGPNYVGSVLEIGANDGITISNSKFFRDLGWQGFLIEAAKKPFDKLIKNVTENSKCYNVALGSENCKLKFYESGRQLGEKDTGLVSSLIMNETSRWRRSGVTYEEHEVDCLTWNSFLEKYNDACPRSDQKPIETIIEKSKKRKNQTTTTKKNEPNKSMNVRGKKGELEV